MHLLSWEIKCKQSKIIPTWCSLRMSDNSYNLGAWCSDSINVKIRLTSYLWLRHVNVGNSWSSCLKLSNDKLISRGWNIKSWSKINIGIISVNARGSCISVIVIIAAIIYLQNIIYSWYTNSLERGVIFLSTYRCILS